MNNHVTTGLLQFQAQNYLSIKHSDMMAFNSLFIATTSGLDKDLPITFLYGVILMDSTFTVTC